VKASEAVESLGPATAELSASMKELEAGFWEDVAGGIDFVSDALHNSEQPFERQIELQKQVIAQLPLLSQAQKDAMLAGLDAKLAAKAQSDAMLDLDLASGRVKVSSHDVAKAFITLDDEGKPVNAMLDRMNDKANDAATGFDTLSSSISEGMFGRAITAGHLAELQQTHDELVKQRDEAKKGSREWQILTGKIAENEQATFDLQLEMAKKEGPAAVLDFLDKAKAKWGKNNDALRTQIDLLATYYGKAEALKSITFGGIIFTGIPTTTRASGGPLAAGQASVVGEEGPEIFVPKTAGTIIPNDEADGPVSANAPSWGGGGGSPVELPIIVDGREIARVVDHRLYLALASAGGSQYRR
jgi:hypothetical protein